MKQKDFNIHRGLAELFASNVYNPQKISTWISRLDHSTTGVELRELKNSLSFKESIDQQENYIYPNPSISDEIYLTEEIQEITFYNNQGGIIVALSHIRKNESIDVSSFPRGVIFYNIKDLKGENKSGKLLLIE